MNDPRHVATGLPSDWTSKLAKYVLRERSEKGYPEEQLLSASQKYGVVPQSFLEQELDRQVMTATKGFENFKLVRPGDFVISLRTFEGGIEFSDHRGIISSAYTVMTPAQALHHGYYRYYLKSEELISRIQAVTTGIREGKTVRYDDFCTLEIPIPPTEIQEAIASFLDRETARIDALIEKKQRQIELLQEKRAALISHAVTKGLDPNVKMKDSGIEWLGEMPEHWTVERVKFIASKIGSGKTPRGGADVYVETGIMLLRSQNIHFDGLRLDDVVFIEPEVDEEMANTRVQGDDVLLNITGASLGRCCRIPKEMPLANVNQHVCIIRPISHKVVPGFVAYSFSSQLVQSQIYANENGTSREGLNFQQVGDLIICFPSDLDEQSKVVHILDEKVTRTMCLVTAVNNSLAMLREYRTALISAAVTGKVDVRKEVA